LTTSVATIPMFNTCAAAFNISTSGTLMGETTTGFFNLNDIDFNSTTCNNLGGYTGNDHVYSISVPTGMTLTVTVTPTGADMANEDPAIYLVPSPATNCGLNTLMCLDAKDDNGGGMPETATYMNATGSAATVFIIVDSLNTGAMAEYSLTTALQ